jgi:tRNA(Ile)-lysidine synthase
VDPGGLDYAAVARVLALAGSTEGSAWAPLPGTGAVERAYAELALVREAGPEPAVFDEVLRIPGETLVPEAGCRVVASEGFGPAPATGGAVGSLPAAMSFCRDSMRGDPVRLRSWRHGDRIELGRKAGTRKVQDVFTDAKVPRPARGAVPLLACRDEVIWIPGYQVAGAWHVPSPYAPAVYLEVDRY